MIITYEAMDTSGRKTRDTVEAVDVQRGLEDIRRRGLYVIRVVQTQDGRVATTSGKEDAGSARLSLKVLVLFTRQMAMMLKAGSGIVPAVSAIKRQLTAPAHVAVLDGIIVALEEGNTLSESMRDYPRAFDPVYCAIIAAGEASASLSEMFERLSVVVGKRRAMRNKILGALAYPALLISMSGSIINVLLFFVLPRFDDMFKQLDAKTPESTQMLLAVGSLLRNHWALLATGCLAVVGGVVAILVTPAGRQWLSNIQLSIPIIGKLRSLLIQAQIFRTMGTLVGSGVGILETIELTAPSTINRRFQKLFGRMKAAVTSGGNISTACSESGIVKPYLYQTIHTGEDTGNLGEAMLFCADMLDESNTELIATATKLIEPAILIVMGGIVGGVAISLFLPLFDLTSAIQ